MNYAKQRNFTSCLIVQAGHLVTNRLSDAFPLVFRIALALPMTTATNERTFSLLKIVKTKLQSMSDPCLSNLCVII